MLAADVSAAAGILCLRVIVELSEYDCVITFALVAVFVCSTTGQDSSYYGRNFHKVFNVQQYYLTCKKCLKFYKEVLNGEIEQSYRGQFNR
jgi:hypothetical protein